MDPYQVLGLRKGASPEEIKAAYKKLAMKTHPDKTGGDDTEFKKVKQAYDSLTKPVDPSPFDGISSFFNSFHKRHIPTDDFQIKLPLSAIVNGTKQVMTVNMPVMCTSCSGKGTRDPTLKVTCPTCKGSGSIEKTVGGMFRIQVGKCSTCRGTGKVIPSAAKCKDCDGEGTVTGSKQIEIDIPPGTPDNHLFSLGKIGSFDRDLQITREVRITVKWSLPDNVRIYNNDIHTTIDCNLSEVLHGFSKKINLYGSDVLISQEGYRNPTLPFVKKGLGINQGDLVVNVNVSWPDKFSLGTS